jgi:hypothetical protein
MIDRVDGSLPSRRGQAHYDELLPDGKEGAWVRGIYPAGNSVCVQGVQVHCFHTKL